MGKGLWTHCVSFPSTYACAHSSLVGEVVFGIKMQRFLFWGFEPLLPCICKANDLDSDQIFWRERAMSYCFWWSVASWVTGGVLTHFSQSSILSYISSMLGRKLLFESIPLWKPPNWCFSFPFSLCGLSVRNHGQNFSNLLCGLELMLLHHSFVHSTHIYWTPTICLVWELGRQQWKKQNKALPLWTLQSSGRVRQ